MTRYHYVLTVQYQAVGGIQQLSYSHGVITPEPGQTRSDLFRQIFRNATSDGGLNPIPLFFSLEPDELDEGSRPTRLERLGLGKVPPEWHQGR